MAPGTMSGTQAPRRLFWSIILSWFPQWLESDNLALSLFSTIWNCNKVIWPMCPSIVPEIL